MAKARMSARDRLAAHLVIIAILAMVLLGILSLYATGIFAPVERLPVLADTPPLNLSTAPPSRSLLDWLFPTASAEGEPSDTASRVDQLLLDERGEYDIAEADRVPEDKNNLNLNQNLPKDWVNILLMATDGRDINAKNGRTDVMIIASLNHSTGEIKLSSLARDLAVQIPGVAKANRLNAAYAYGGPNLSIRTINKVFEMNIKYYAVVNFASMAAIVDELGGVSLALIEGEPESINELVAVGEDYEGFAKNSARRTLTAEDVGTVVHLDGLQAVSYARVRKIDNDLQRGSRQRILLQALMDQVMPNLNSSMVRRLVTTMIPHVATNLPFTEMVGLPAAMLRADAITIADMAIPIEGTYRNETIDDKDMISFNQKQNVEALHNFIYGAYYPANPL
ncbi:MAG: LCP family protein [Oscillospiraceae bacterium]|jgi:LCP family protein required for cell wall assembly|nr:LCP family protein [Oscillospiraceae bacterium]